MLRMVGLFAGIGGIEQGFRRTFGDGPETRLLCESWAPAQAVLSDRFPGVPIHPDVRELVSIPAGTDVLAAGFPCTDLSQAGMTAGIRGIQSGLIAHVFDALRSSPRRRPAWVLVENVQNMLALGRGQAMAYLVGELEELGYRWAYRVVNSRFTGVPQRRRRVILLAGRRDDPRTVLFADDAGEPAEEERYRRDAFGFYWTEGLRGLGWGRDAVPTLKGGSSLGIPSPPAIWVPGAEPGRKLVVPTVEEAERLQGFPSGWTRAAAAPRRKGTRWKLVGNAVTVGVAAWVAGRVQAPGEPVAERRKFDGTAWPSAAWGERGQQWRAEVSEYPCLAAYRHLADAVDLTTAAALSHRAAAGFWRRLQQGNLGREPGFRADVAEHVALTTPRPLTATA